jgi:DNA-binding NtrC family response regulator
MATVYSVVTQAGGQIAVDSEPGKGTLLRVTFPRDNTPVVLESPGRDSALPFAARGRVLVVEDQPEVRVVACTILRNLGLEVLEASDGEGALTLADTDPRPIDLLLTDVIMPGLNGRDLAGRFTAKRPQTRVIYMSGYTDRIMSPDGLLDSSVSFLQKPFKPEDLARLVSRALSS